MSVSEFHDWIAFYLAHPFDDLHRYHRPAVVTLGKAAPEALEWLCPEPAPAEDLTEIDLSLVRAFGVKR